MNHQSKLKCVVCLIVVSSALRCVPRMHLPQSAEHHKNRVKGIIDPSGGKLTGCLVKERMLDGGLRRRGEVAHAHMNGEL